MDVFRTGLVFVRAERSTRPPKQRAAADARYGEKLRWPLLEARLRGIPAEELRQ
jgi:hypothetical protein